MNCPECAGTLTEQDEREPFCEYCGFVLYSQWTLQLMNEVKQEQAECKRILGYVPDYKVAKAKGLAK
jgi:transcription initiation factor TFIIIB Brf1 subunit/transcription initiation factor TFIIB